VRLKRTFYTALMIVCMIFMLLPKGHIAYADAVPRTIYVHPTRPDANFTTIQAAIGNANDGDRIMVYSATYVECVVVNKSVSLVGENRASTIVTGVGGEPVFHVLADHVVISNFAVMSSGDYGIFVDFKNDNNITQNTIVSSKGIYLRLSSGNVISGNAITGCSFSGIELSNSNNNLVFDNDVRDNSQMGIVVSQSNNNTILDNDISGNPYVGLVIQSSESTVVTGNNVTGNNLGMWLTTARYGTISGNNITSNQNGVSIESSSENSFYRNNFASTTNVWVTTPGASNSWDYLGEGNHWNNYVGHDLNGDGVGDTPYNITGGMPDQDRCPLMGVYTNYVLTFAGSTYDSYVISNSTISAFRLELGQETANKIIRFTADGQPGSSGFCRIAVPKALMPTPLIVLIDSKEVIPKMLNFSEGPYTRLYFTYLHRGQTITIIYSEALHLYYSLLDSFLALQFNMTRLQSDYGMLNDTYYVLLADFTRAQLDLTSLNTSYSEMRSLNSQLNVSYAVLQASYNALLVTLGQLQSSFAALNTSYTMLTILNSSHYGLLHDYGLLAANYSLLHVRFAELNASYQNYIEEYSQDYQKQTQNLRNLLYVFASTTALFVITTVYLSKRAHASKTTKTKRE